MKIYTILNKEMLLKYYQVTIRLLLISISQHSNIINITSGRNGVQYDVEVRTFGTVSSLIEMILLIAE